MKELDYVSIEVFFFTETGSRSNLACGQAYTDPCYKQNTVEEGKKIQTRNIEKLPRRANKTFET